MLVAFWKGSERRPSVENRGVVEPRKPVCEAEEPAQVRRDFGRIEGRPAHLRGVVIELAKEGDEILAAPRLEVSDQMRPKLRPLDFPLLDEPFAQLAGASVFGARLVSRFGRGRSVPLIQRRPLLDGYMALPSRPPAAGRLAGDDPPVRSG